MPHTLLAGAAPMQRKKLEIASNSSWDDLRLFLLCARHRSFKGAADVTGLTATALIKRIEKLEDQLGLKLFNVDTANLSLTGEGRALLFDVEQMDRLSQNVLRRAAAPSDITGTVRIVATEGPGNFWILPRLIKFEDTYRKLLVDLRCVAQQADVARHEADISVQLERPSDPELIAIRLGRIHIHAFASQAYLDAHGVPKSLSDLRNHRIIKQSRRHQNDSAFARVLGLETLEGTVGIATNSSVVVLYAVEQGAGIGFLPTSTLAVGAPLVAVDLGISYHVDLWLACHRRFRHSDRHRLVIAWLKSIFDPKVYACFRDEFIHPNDLIPLMVGSREHFGLKAYAPPQPFSLENL
jgi:DNA-binding transcriptional LysR family regulator